MAGAWNYISYAAYATLKMQRPDIWRDTGHFYFELTVDNYIELELGRKNCLTHVMDDRTIQNHTSVTDIGSVPVLNFLLMKI